MLYGYFDDSGTHKDARIVVWGGIVGDSENYAYLDHHWAALLANPLPHKPPLQEFHVSEFKGGYGKFRNYRVPKERDDLRLKFRQVIIDSGFTPLAVGVDRQAWDAIAVGSDMARMVSAEALAFGLCCKKAVEIAEKYAQCMTASFDKGRKKAVGSMLRAVQWQFPHSDERLCYKWSVCTEEYGLQAADTVAYELYHYGSEWLRDSGAIFAPTLRHLYDGVDYMRFEILDHSALATMVAKTTLADRSASPDHTTR